MSSSDLAAKVLRAQKVADYVTQISEIEFLIESEQPNKLLIGNKKIVITTPILDVDFSKIPDDIQEAIGLDHACYILNKHLEIAKTEIMQIIQDSIFAGNELGKDEDDGFEEIKK